MNAQLKAACMAASLVGFWGNAEASIVTLNLDDASAAPLSSATGLYQYNQSGDPDNDATRLTSTTDYPTVLGGISTHVAGDSQYYNSLNTRVPYTFIGVYPLGGLVIAMNATAALVVTSTPGITWEDVFTGVPGSMTEVEVKSNIESGAYFAYGFTSFMAANESLFPSWGEVGALVKFSDATYAGTIEATPVPEPTTLVALGVGLALLGRRRKG